MTEKTTSKPGRNRRKSRELALKGLYSLFVGGGDVREIIAGLAEEEDYPRADAEYLNELLRGVATTHNLNFNRLTS